MATRRVNFRLDAEDNTARGIGSATRRLKKLGTTAKIAIGNIAAGAVQAGFNAITRSIRGVTEAFDRLQKLGLQTGLEPAFLRQLELVSTQAGTSLERTVRLVRRLQEAASELATTGQSEGLEALGLNARELRRLRPDEVLRKYLRALESIDDQSLKTAAATRLVGDRLTEVSLLLAAQGEAVREGLAEPIDEALNEASDRIAKFNDDVTEAFQSIENAAAKTFGGVLRLFDASAVIDDLNKAKGIVKETAELARFTYIEAPTKGGLILERFGKKRDKEIEEKNKKEKEDAEEREEAAKSEYDTIIAGLQAIIALEEKRRNAGRGGSQGELGVDAVRFARPDEAPSRARAVLEGEVQRKQLAAQQKLVEILGRQTGNTAEFG